MVAGEGLLRWRSVHCVHSLRSPAHARVSFTCSQTHFSWVQIHSPLNTQKAAPKERLLYGSGRGIRTHDTRIMIPPLYRLSYPAIKFEIFNNMPNALCQHIFFLKC